MATSVIIIRGIAAELQRTGIAPARVLSALGITADQLADLRSRVSPNEVSRIVHKAIEVAGDPGLGLSMGMHSPESMLQVVSHLALACRTMRDALMTLRQYLPLVADGLTWNLEESDELATFTYDSPHTSGVLGRFSAEYAVTMMMRVGVRIANDQAAKPERVTFRHAAPEYQARYRQAFDCPVLFGQPTNSIVCNRRWLDTPNLYADLTVLGASRMLADAMLQEISEPRTTAERVRVLLSYDSWLAEVDGRKLARAFGLTRRTLTRRLAEEGVTLHDLVEEARRTLACKELRRGQTIDAVAQRVGFSERSAFHRAFKRWTGHTPREYRTLDIPGEPLELAQAAES